jgi:hypothetical protein
VGDDTKTKRQLDTPFIMIPVAISRDPALSPAAKLLFGAIYSFWHMPDGCHCTNEILGARLGLSTVHVQRLIKELEAKKLIRRTIRKRHLTEIDVIWRGKRIKVRREPDKKPDQATPPNSEQPINLIGHSADEQPINLIPQNPPIGCQIDTSTSRARASASGDEDLKKSQTKKSSPLVSSPPSAPRRKSDAPARPVELPPDVEAEMTARADAKKAAFAEAARLRKANGQA